jgi:putative chitobiose transport system substrate-binding protein
MKQLLGFRLRHFAYCVLALPLLLVSCSRPDQRTTIEFWTLQLTPTFDEYFTSLIEEYEREHPDIRIAWVDIPYDAAIQKLLAAAAANQAPDVVNLSTDFLSRFAAMGALEDIATVLPPDSLSRFFPNALASCTHGGALVALPWYLDTYALIYNTRLLREAGFTERDIPTTFSDLVRFVRQYKNRTRKFALFWNIGRDSYLPIMLESEGVAMTDSALHRATFNSPRGVELVSQWVDLYRNGYLQRESIINRGTSIIEQYQAGQVAMVLTGPVFLERVKANAPNIYAQTAIAPVPVGATGKQELAIMALSILSSSTHKKEAAAFAMFVLSARNQLRFSKITPTYPSVVEALADSFFAVDEGSVESRARIIGAKALPRAYTLGMYTRHPYAVRLREIFGEAIQKACLGTMTTRQALDAAATAWDEILSRQETAFRRE